MTERASVVASKRQRQVQPRTAERVTQCIRLVRVDQARCRHLRKGNLQAGHSAGIQAVWSDWDAEILMRWPTSKRCVWHGATCSLL